MLTVNDLIKTQIIILRTILSDNEPDHDVRVKDFAMLRNCELMFKIANPFQGFERKVLDDGCEFLINELNKMLEK